MANKLYEVLESRILLLDGGFGTMVQQYGFTEEDYRGERFRDWNVLLKGCNDLLAVTRPGAVREIHVKYLQAGADIIETDSFNANAVSLADYGLEAYAYEISRAAAGVARSAADEFTARNPQKPRFVAGSIGPTNRTASMSADVGNPAAREVTFTQLAEAYTDQARGLVDGGADVLLVETVFDTLNAKAALYAIDTLAAQLGRAIPVMISGTLADASGRTLSGQTVEAFYASVSHARLLSVGFNCAYGARQLMPYLERLAAVAEFRISAHPNAGLPNVMGGYDETPEMFARDVGEYMRRGLVNIVGGCCGTTPAHIFELAKIAGNYAPRPVPAPKHVTTLSGLEPLRIVPEANFVNVGERTNVAGSAKFARLIREGNYEEALSVARAQVDAGAQIVDVCMDDGLIDGAEAMRTFLNLMASEPEIARVPTMIDSSKWEVLVAGLQVTQGKAVVNSISLKEGEAEFLRRAQEIHRYGAAAVVMLFDERGQADTYERKTEVAGRAYKLLTDAGFPAEDIIFDPNVLAVATGIPEHDSYAKAFIDATRWIKRNLPHAKVSGGVSNLSFAFRGNNAVREAMHSAFLYHAIRAGMDMGIVNPQMVRVYSEIEPELLERVEDVILCRRPDAAERLTEYAQQVRTVAQTQPQAPDAWRAGTLSERIGHAMLKGVADFIEQDALEGYEALGSPMAVIDTLLMPAMEHVGTLFGEGKMFLPQVVKTARVMKRAVAALTPYIEQGAAGVPNRAGKVLIATVKGDVHDIGKNIVAVVMACNGYEIKDLGVMVESQRIVDEAVAWGADCICLSGLITPSLDEMAHVCEELERRALRIPVIIGGDDLRPAHGGEDRPGLRGRGCPFAQRQPQQPDTGTIARPRRGALRRQSPRRTAGYAERIRARRAHTQPDPDRRGAQSPQGRHTAPSRRTGTPRTDGLPRFRRGRCRALHRLELLFPGMGVEGTLPRDPRPPRKGGGGPQGIRRRASAAGTHPRRAVTHAASRRRHLPGAFRGRRHLDHRPQGPRTPPGDAPQPDPRAGQPFAGGFHRPGRRLDRLLRRDGGHRTEGAVRKIPRRGRRLQRHHGQAAGRPTDRGVRRSRALVRAAADVGLRNRRSAHTPAGHPRRIPRTQDGVRLPRIARPFAQARGFRPAGGRTDHGHETHGKLHGRSRGGTLRTAAGRRGLLLGRHGRHQTTARLRPAPRTGCRTGKKTHTA